MFNRQFGTIGQNFGLKMDFFFSFKAKPTVLNIFFTAFDPHQSKIRFSRPGISNLNFGSKIKTERNLNEITILNFLVMILFIVFEQLQILSKIDPNFRRRKRKLKKPFYPLENSSNSI